MIKPQLIPTHYKAGKRVIRATIRRPMSDRWNPVVYLYDDESVRMLPKKISSK